MNLTLIFPFKDREGGFYKPGVTFGYRFVRRYWAVPHNFSIVTC